MTELKGEGGMSPPVTLSLIRMHHELKGGGMSPASYTIINLCALLDGEVGGISSITY